MSYQEPHEPEGTTQRRRTLAGFGRTEEWRIYRCHDCKRKTWAAVGWPGKPECPECGPGIPGRASEPKGDTSGTLPRQGDRGRAVRLWPQLGTSDVRPCEWSVGLAADGQVRIHLDLGGDFVKLSLPPETAIAFVSQIISVVEQLTQPPARPGPAAAPPPSPSTGDE